MSIAEYLRRVIDDKPMAAHLYVTDRCNLDCHYCNEYDNSAPHPAVADLDSWMRHIRRLGVSRLSFQGGEPLLHPEIVEITRRAKGLGFYRIGMSSNGLLLEREVLLELERAGLDTLQMSIDGLTPSAASRKSLRSLSHKLDWFRGSKVDLRVSGVLFSESQGDAAALVDACVQRGIRVHMRVVHDDLVGGRKLRPQATGTLMAALEHQSELKRRGEPIHSSWNILAYERALLRGEPVDWDCAAGYKYFFVSARGEFWPCSQRRTNRHILDVTAADLRSYDRPKDCQEGCGVYCIVDTSLAVSHPVRYVAREIGGLARTMAGRLRKRRT